MITVDEFCDKEMLSGAERQAFRQWLGDTANAKMSHAEWWKLFREWVRSKSYTSPS